MDRREDAIFVLIEQERLLLFGLLPEGSQVLAVLGPDGGQATDVGFRAVDPTVVWPSSSRGRLVMVSGRRGGSGFNTMWAGTPPCDAIVGVVEEAGKGTNV